MIVLVNDANILIDLLKLDLLAPFFQLPCQFHVTDLAAGEILEENVDELNRYIEGGTLLKRSFEFEELLEIRRIQDAHGGLSFPDCSSVFLSTELSATLLTGDAVLRRAAEKHGIRVHGMLWVFEELVGQSILSKSIAHKKLARLMQINPRLPVRECRKRLNAWR